MRGKRKRWVIILILVLAAAGGGGYYYWDHRASAAQSTAETAALQTARVRTGDLVLSATAAGTVIAADEVGLGFKTSGELTELDVQVGDTVRAGDMLARIDDLNARSGLLAAQAQLSQAQQTLQTAQQAADDLQAAPAMEDLLAAQAAVKTAEENLADLKAGPSEAELAAARSAVATAQEAYQTLKDGPTDEELEQAQLNLEQAKNSLWSSQMSRDARGTDRDKASGAYDQAQVSVLNGEISVRKAELELADLQKPPTDVELQSAQATLAQAQAALAELQAGPSAAEIAQAEATLAQAQADLATLTDGPTDEELAQSDAEVQAARLGVDQAQLALEEAQRASDAVTLTAPMDGTVTGISAAAGDTVGTDAVITLADLHAPVLEVFVDETDMDKIAVGYEADVTLDAMPDTVFKGTVTEVDPVLTQESGVSAIRGLVQLDPDSYSKPQGLPVGLNATVDVIGGRAQNAVLVPVEALREIGSDRYGVFVMDSGEPRLRQVQVGLMDITYAQITSGLQPGEIVSTGIVETQ